ncbi:tail fiber protein [Pedobacter sp.]|nr:tail fiber protein [Candidatus Saccharibacteria bacterium]
MITPGTYHQNSNAAATLVLNYPAVFAGLLEVESPSSSFIYQRYTAYKGGLDRVYVRGYYSALWSAWSETAKVGVNDGRFAGEVATSAAVTVPTGWLACDGVAVSRTTYAGLFTAISTTYGAGDGSTTFNVPNYKGRALVGMDTAQSEFDVLGESGGTKTHTLLATEMPSHTHIQDTHNHTQNAHTHLQNAHGHTQDAHAHGLTVGGVAAVGSTTSGLVNYGTSTYAATGGVNSIVMAAVAATNQATTSVNQNTTATNISVTATNQNTGGDGAHNNLQPYMTVSYIIHY